MLTAQYFVGNIECLTWCCLCGLNVSLIYIRNEFFLFLLTKKKRDNGYGSISNLMNVDCLTFFQFFFGVTVGTTKTKTQLQKRNFFADACAARV